MPTISEDGNVYDLVTAAASAGCSTVSNNFSVSGNDFSNCNNTTQNNCDSVALLNNGTNNGACASAMGFQDSKIEQLMMSMLDQRDKLTDQLQKTQRHISEIEDRLREADREKESLRRQLELQSQHLPGVCFKSYFF